MTSGYHGPMGELGSPPKAVRKAKGYPFRGHVVSEFTTLAGKERVVVDNGDGMLHIYNCDQLIPDHPEHQYLDLLAELVAKAEGDVREDRTGVGTYSVFGRQIRFDLSKGFPLLTTKRVHWKSVLVELLWFLRGDTNIKFLNDHGVTIWDEWADESGELGPVYGKQWRSWRGKSWQTFDGGDTYLGLATQTIDQISNLIQDLKQNPYSRRHVVTAWNPADLPDMALAPCHCLFQLYVEDGKLSCQLFQRSADIFLGVPFNIASYALLTHMLAREAGLYVGEFVHTFGDVHLYSNHVEQAKEQLTRLPKPFGQVGFMKNDKTIFELSPEDVVLNDYDPHPPIKAPVAI